jgi:mRNA interferase HigB
VIKRLPLLEFGKIHKDAVNPLDDWFRSTEGAEWKNFPQVKQTFGQTDVAKVQSDNTVCIFDIGGNKYRIIAKISYEKGKVYVLRVLTHKEYDTNKWKAEL